jgi:hypothetical protein
VNRRAGGPSEARDLSPGHPGWYTIAYGHMRHHCWSSKDNRSSPEGSRGAVIQRTDEYVVCTDKTANKRRMKMTARVYAQIVGVVVILIGVVGLILGDQSLGGLLNIDILDE